MMSESEMVRLTREEIDHAALLDEVRTHQAGAALLFLGTVREMTNGRQTVALDYDAYPEMAIARMQALCEEAHERFSLTGVRVEHRLGRLELGDVSIAVAVSSPHRAAAFEAGRMLIDRLKEEVPIWKKENWADGTTEWVHPGTADNLSGNVGQRKDLRS